MREIACLEQDIAQSPLDPSYRKHKICRHQLQHQLGRIPKEVRAIANAGNLTPKVERLILKNQPTNNFVENFVLGGP